MRLAELRERIDRGEYQVNAHAVADAIVSRLRADAARARRDDAPGGHAECS